MALRFRPVDTAFYDLFTEPAQHLVVGAGAARRDAREAATARTSPTGCAGRARGRRDHPRAVQAGQHDVRDAVRPRGHLPPRLRARRRHGHDGRGRRPDPALRGEGAPRRAVPAGRGDPAVRRAHRDRDAGAAVAAEASRSTGSRSTGSRTPATRTTGGSWPSCSRGEFKTHRGAQAEGHRGGARERAIDAFESVANIVEQIAVKES